MRTRTSLARNKRLGEVLAEGGCRPEDEVMQELPGAVLAEWPHWRQGGSEGIARRVFHQLECGGDQAQNLARKGKRADAELDGVSEADAGGGFGPEEDLAKFQLRETRRQQRRQLDALERVGSRRSRQRCRG
jgi:hypothetical protein